MVGLWRTLGLQTADQFPKVNRVRPTHRASERQTTYHLILTIGFRVRSGRSGRLGERNMLVVGQSVGQCVSIGKGRLRSRPLSFLLPFRSSSSSVGPPQLFYSSFFLSSWDKLEPSFISRVT